MKRVFQLATVLMLILAVIGTTLVYAEETSQSRDAVKNATEGVTEKAVDEVANATEGVTEKAVDETKKIEEEVSVTEGETEKTTEEEEVKVTEVETEVAVEGEEVKVTVEETGKATEEEEATLTKEERIKLATKRVLNREEILITEKFRALKREEVKKIEKLEDRELRVLNKLEEWKLKKLSKLEEKKLARLAKLEHKELRKLARLKESELNKLSELDEAKLKKIGRLNRAEIKRLALKNSDELAKVDFDEEITKRDDFRRKAFIKREIAKEKVTRAREDFKVAKEKRKKAKNQLETARGEFLEAKSAIAECEGVETEECDVVREKVKTRSKAFLLHTADVVISELEKVKSKLESSEDLSEEEVAEWVTNIDAKIEEIENAKATIESAENKDEVIDAAQLIKKEWLFTRHQIKKLAGLLIHKRVRGIIAKADILEERLDEILSDLEEDEVDTTEIDALVDAFSEKIAEAKDEYELAQEKWLEVAEIKSSYSDVTPEDLKEADLLLKEATDHVKTAHAATREAHAILKKIVKLVKDKEAHVTNPDKPDYTPGEDLGYFIWQGNAGIWTVCLSGDGKAHIGKGTIKADEGFAIVRPFLYERRTDRYIIFDTEIAFRAWVKPHQDCLRLGTASEEVTFELYIDGEQTDQIYVGKDNEQYTSPVTLAGKPCAKCIEEPEIAEVEEGYELVKCTTSEDCTGEGATCSADGVCVIETEEVEE